MISRSFFLSLQQAFRSVFLILFPLAFISLFAWATAGATTGSTNDPLRAAIWLWLSAHLANATTVLGENQGVISYLKMHIFLKFYIQLFQLIFPAQKHQVRHQNFLTLNLFCLQTALTLPNDNF